MAASTKKRVVARPGYKVVFRPYITTKSGRVIYARTYGIRAFPILVPE